MKILKKILKLFHIFHQKLSYSGNFTEAASTTFIHNGVVMTEYQNEPFIVGDYNHNQVEFMHQSHLRWYTAIEFPFYGKVYGFAAVSRPGKVFILGGCCGNDWKTISLCENDQWSKIGNLIQGRINHHVIAYGTDLMIIGGTSRNNQP